MRSVSRTDKRELGVGEERVVEMPETKLEEDVVVPSQL
jgi:hypothetical protein